MYKGALNEIEEWKQQEKRMQNRLNLTVAGKMSKKARKSISPLVDDKLAQENAKTVEKNLINAKERLRTRPSIKLNPSNNPSNDPQQGPPGSQGSDTMKAFKDKMLTIRKNMNEINNSDKESDGGEEESGDLW
jgi:hypothetical protein